MCGSLRTQLGNHYYEDNTQQFGRHRWVEYAGLPWNSDVEATSVGADWHGWLHHMTDLTGDNYLLKEPGQITVRCGIVLGQNSNASNFVLHGGATDFVFISFVLTVTALCAVDFSDRSPSIAIACTGTTWALCKTSTNGTRASSGHAATTAPKLPCLITEVRTRTSGNSRATRCTSVR